VKIGLVVFTANTPEISGYDSLTDHTDVSKRSGSQWIPSARGPAMYPSSAEAATTAGLAR